MQLTPKKTITPVIVAVALFYLAGILWAQSNPTFTVYLAGFRSQMTTILNSISGLAQPKIVVSMQDYPLAQLQFTACDPVSILGGQSAIGFSPSACVGVAVCDPSVPAFSPTSCRNNWNSSTVPNVFADAMNRLGITATEINMDAELAVTFPEYGSSSLTANQTTFNGSGLNDCVLTGPITGSAALTTLVQLTANGASDTFQFGQAAGNIAGVTIGTPTTITGGNVKQALGNGISIACNAASGHHIGDQWVITLIPGDGPSGWFAKTQTNFDTAMVHLKANGTKIRFRPAPSNNLNIDCGLTSTSTVVDLMRCFLPIYAAMMAHYPGGASPAIDTFHVFHEAGGGIWINSLPASISISTSDWTNFANQTATAIHNLATAEGTGTKTGADYLTQEAALFAAGSTNANLDVIGLDVYPTTWDVTQYSSTAIATAATQIATILANGKIPRITETAAPVWANNGASNGNEPNAIEPGGGGGNVAWDTNGRNQLFQYVITHWAGAQGANGVSFFYPGPFFWTTSDGANDNMNSIVPQAAYNAKLNSNLGLTSHQGSSLATLWPSALTQGHVATAGRVQIQ